MPTSILSYSDFISRPDNKDSVITFEKVSIKRVYEVTTETADINSQGTFLRFEQK